MYLMYLYMSDQLLFIPVSVICLSMADMPLFIIMYQTSLLICRTSSSAGADS